MGAVRDSDDDGRGDGVVVGDRRVDDALTFADLDGEASTVGVAVIDGFVTVADALADCDRDGNGPVGLWDAECDTRFGDIDAVHVALRRPCVGDASVVESDGVSDGLREGLSVFVVVRERPCGDSDMLPHDFVASAVAEPYVRVMLSLTLTVAVSDSRLRVR